MAGIITDSASYRRAYRKIAAQDCHDFLQRVAKPDSDWKDPDVYIEYGEPDSLLRDYVRDRGADLVVLGTQGRSALTEVLFGSVAKRIMDGVPGDTLIVRKPAAQE